ncbi:VOC family protein [Mesorhizobium sp. NPDC059054]|uniref:VOC family protein n=1 Tax=Mesorhizobium sp. NPDC059054 TaxID=3346711 RepID=UPI0036A2BC37
MAEPMPGVRGINHIGLTVPDIKAAESFFVDVMGCQKATSFGPFRDDKGDFMKDLVDVDPRAVINEITLLRCQSGSNIELFDYSAPDKKDVRPRNSDNGGHHIAFYVDDIDAAAKYLTAKGIRTLKGPMPVNEGPAAGQSILYFFAPWGLQLEAISFPKGMAYEKNGGTVLWSNTDPSK